MFCHKCGAKNVDDALFCRKCGTKIAKTGNTPSVPSALNTAKPYQPKVTNAVQSPQVNYNFVKIAIPYVLAVAGIGIICVVCLQNRVKTQHTPSYNYSASSAENFSDSTWSSSYNYSSNVDNFPNKNVNFYTSRYDESSNEFTYIPEDGSVTILGLEYDIADTAFLDLNNQNVTNETLKDIIKLTELTELRIWDTNVTDISLLPKLPNLSVLYLSGDDLNDIRPLSRMMGLNELYLFGTGISDISALSTLSELKTVDLGGNDITNISPLAYCTSLETLYLHNEVIDDLSPLENLTNLRSLSITYSEIGSITPLGYLTNLTYLNLEGTAVDNSDLNWLHSKLQGCEINI